MQRAPAPAASPLGRACVALALGWAVACTHYVTRGSDLYHQGRYVEAAHVLEKTEVRLAGASDVERATYGLYRGATLLRLGDLAGASHWLQYAREQVRSGSALLSPEEEQLLRETWIALQVDLDRRAASEPGR